MSEVKRSFEFAREVIKTEDGIKYGVDPDTFEVVKAYPKAQLPKYMTKNAAGADFFCAETVVIPSIWKSLIRAMGACIETFSTESIRKMLAPTLVHTGIKSCMPEDEVLEIYNRSSGPKKKGLILANSVGIIDADFYNNTDNDGEIGFMFYNIMPFDVTIDAGDRIGQGIFKKVLRPTEGLVVADDERQGGIGSTDK